MINVFLHANAENSQTKMSIECEDITFFYSEDGQLKYKLEAPKILKQDKEALKFEQGGTLTSYENKKIKFIAHAMQASCDAEYKIWNLKGDVYVISDDVRLDTSEVNWDRNTELVQTEALVKIKKGESYLVGEGLLAKQDLSYYTITKPHGVVSGELLN